MKKIDWQHINRRALTVVAVVALLASYRLMTTHPPFRDCRDCRDPFYFLILLVSGAVAYVVIACFFALFVWNAVGAIIEAWSKPPPLKEMLWLRVFVAMAVLFGIVTVAWVIGPFAPSISRYVWNTRL